MSVDQNSLAPRVFINGDLVTGDDLGHVTRRDLGSCRTVLLGRLVRPPYTSGQPCIQVEAGCPWCRRNHRHGWVNGDHLDSLAHRVAHCKKPGSPFRESGGYWVGLDPERKAENRAVAAGYLRDLSDWQARSR